MAGGAVKPLDEAEAELREAEREAEEQSRRRQKNEALLRALLQEHKKKETPVGRVLESISAERSLAKPTDPEQAIQIQRRPAVSWTWLLLVGMASGVFVGYLWSRFLLKERFMKAWAKRRDKIKNLLDLLKRMRSAVEWDKVTGDAVKKSKTSGPARQLLKAMASNHGPVLV